MPIRRVISSERNGTEVLPCMSDSEKLSIDPYGRIYLAYKEEEQWGESLYKLHLDITDHLKKKVVYRWLAMWSSNVWTNMGNKDSFSTIEEAIKSAINSGYIVVQANWDNFKDLIYNIKHA